MKSVSLSSPRLGERLLGAFVILQLFVIPLGSYIKLIPVRYPEHHGELNGELQARLSANATVNEPSQTIKDSTAYALSRWGEVSGQAQCWALFATFGVQAAMPAVELNWPDREPLTMRCHFDPNDPSRYFFPPEPCCRLFNYEYRTVIYYWASRPEDYTDEPEKHRRESMETARDQSRSTTAYLRWKLDRYLKAHPDESPPEFVTLKARILPDPPAGASRLERPASYEVPVARWFPGRSAESIPSSLEIWDPLAKQFVALSAMEVP